MAALKTKARAVAAAAAPVADPVVVRALDPIRCDGLDFAPGDLLELSPADAEALVAGGWAELARLDPAELSLVPAP